jgi:hypothetical protein
MAPLRIEPCRGKAVENVMQSTSGNKPGDVFEEHQRRFNSADDPEDLRPEPAIVVGTGPSAGGAPGLTGETGSDAIHSATPGGRVEVGQVTAPKRSRLQARLFHPGQENGRSETFPLSDKCSPGSEPEELEPGADAFVEHADA